MAPHLGKSLIRAAGLLVLATVCLPANGAETGFAVPWLQLLDADDQVIAPVVGLVSLPTGAIGPVPLVRFEIDGTPVLLAALVESPTSATPSVSGLVPPGRGTELNTVHYSGADCIGNAYIAVEDADLLAASSGWIYGVGRCISDSGRTCIFGTQVTPSPANVSTLSASGVSHSLCFADSITQQAWPATEVKVLDHPTPWRLE